MHTQISAMARGATTPDIGSSPLRAMGFKIERRQNMQGNKAMQKWYIFALLNVRSK